MSPSARRTPALVAVVAATVLGIPALGWAATRLGTAPTRPVTGGPTVSPSLGPPARPTIIPSVGTSQPQASSSSSGSPTPAPPPGTVRAALDTLAVRGRAPRTGYARELFGQVWLDVDRNGCDTRNDVLRRDLTGYVLKAGTHGCLVLSGTLHDPYTGATIAFVRGPTTSEAVQVDHVVALSDAWQKGAQQWSPQQRAAFANDSLNLLAVDGPSNRRKGDGDAATWLPPATAYRCPYAAQQVAVKVTYGLWVTAAEHAALARLLDGCPTQRLPVSEAFVLGGGVEAAGEPAPPSALSPAPATSS